MNSVLGGSPLLFNIPKRFKFSINNIKVIFFLQTYLSCRFLFYRAFQFCKLYSLASLWSLPNVFWIAQVSTSVPLLLPVPWSFFSAPFLLSLSCSFLFCFSWALLLFHIVRDFSYRIPLLWNIQWTPLWLLNEAQTL